MGAAFPEDADLQRLVTDRLAFLAAAAQAVRAPARTPRRAGFYCDMVRLDADCSRPLHSTALCTSSTDVARPAGPRRLQESGHVVQHLRGASVDLCYAMRLLFHMVGGRSAERVCRPGRGFLSAASRLALKLVKV